jgi:hypothetical protein
VYGRADIVDRQELITWLKEIGGRESSLDDILNNSDQIICYTEGQHERYAHKDALGLNGQKQQLVRNAVCEWLRMKQQATGKTFVVVDEGVLSESELPPLNIPVPWTVELVTDTLKQDDSFLLVTTSNLKWIGLKS